MLYHIILAPVTQYLTDKNMRPFVVVVVVVVVVVGVGVGVVGGVFGVVVGGGVGVVVVGVVGVVGVVFGVEATRATIEARDFFLRFLNFGA